MTVCENKAAAAYAFPPSEMPVADRRITLTVQCHEEAEFTNTLLSLGNGRQRKGAKPTVFHLCANHSGLFEQIDRELIQDAWARAHTEPPVRLI